MPAQRVELPYVVAIPIPRLNWRGRKLPVSLVRLWKENTLRFFGECFGGAIATRSAGPYRHQDGTVVFDRGQWVVQAGCSSRGRYLRHRRQIEEFAEELGRALDQESMFVLAYPRGDSVILFLKEDSKETP